MLLHGTQIEDGSIPLAKLVSIPGGAFAVDGSGNTYKSSLTPAWTGVFTNNVLLANDVTYSITWGGNNNTLLGRVGFMDTPPAANVYDNFLWNTEALSYIKSVNTGSKVRDNFIASTALLQIDNTYNNAQTHHNIFLGTGLIKTYSNYAGAYENIIIGKGTIWDTGLNPNPARRSMILGPASAAYPNKVDSTTYANIIGGFYNYLYGSGGYTTVIGCRGVNRTTGGDVNNLSVIVPRLYLWQGTLAAGVPTAGATHSLAWNSATGEVVQNALSTPGFSVSGAGNLYPSARAITSGTPGNNNTVLNEPLTAYLKPHGNYNLFAGKYSYHENQILGSAHTFNSNVIFGSFTGFKTVAGNTGFTGEYNFFAGETNYLRGLNTATNAVFNHNFITGRNNYLRAEGTAAGAIASYNTFLSSEGMRVKLSANTAYFDHNAIISSEGTVTFALSSAGFGAQNNAIIGARLGIKTFTPGANSMLCTAIIGTSAVTLNGGLGYSAVIAAQNTTLGDGQMVGVIASNSTSLTGTTAFNHHSNTLVSACSSLTNAGNYTTSAVAFIGLTSYALAANTANTVIMPKLKVGRGTGGALPTTGATRILGMDDTTGDVIEMPAVYFATVALTQAQIQALNTTPIQLVAAPGANKVIEIESVTATNNFNTAAFATATQIYLVDATVAAARFISSTSFVTASAKRVEQMVPVAAAVETGVNQALQIKADADATLGNAASTIDVDVKYRILDV